VELFTLGAGGDPLGRLPTSLPGAHGRSELKEHSSAAEALPPSLHSPAAQGPKDEWDEVDEFFRGSR
jgi:hypothetical protein